MYSSAYVWAKVLSHMEEKLGSIPHPLSMKHGSRMGRSEKYP